MITLIKNALRPVKHLISPCPLLHTFSQEGEDRILGRIFEKKAEGFYVDVGAHHPIHLSLSVDVEVFDLPVLRSNDWNLFRPEIVLAEDFSCENVEEALNAPMATFLRSVGYVLFAKTGYSGVYKRL